MIHFYNSLYFKKIVLGPWPFSLWAKNGREIGVVDRVV
jgi:hypothetical protein